MRKAIDTLHRDGRARPTVKTVVACVLAGLAPEEEDWADVTDRACEREETVVSGFDGEEEGVTTEAVVVRTAKIGGSAGRPRRRKKGKGPGSIRIATITGARISFDNTEWESLSVLCEQDLRVR